MDIIIITNNSKVLNFYKETNDVIFNQKQDLGELLELIKNKVYGGHRMLSDPILSNLESPENPYKSIAISKEVFTNNEEQKRLIDGAIGISKKIENRKKFYDFNETVLEEYRFVDLNLLNHALKVLEK
ncbi:GrdX family protein [Fusobacterium sp. PH5-44]|uniref:GrdX family protein n=1 Tax=unclassified Fusobacterium TaxID=2648384 RepID=UPI003D25A8FA